MPERPPPSILLAATGLRIGGGIASVSRCIARALDEAIEAGLVARADRVLLMDAPGTPPPRVGDQHLAQNRATRFFWHAWTGILRRRPDLVIVDHLGVGRALRVPLPGLPPARYAVFVHGTELDPVHRGLRAAVLTGAWRILTNSRFTANRVAQRFPEVEPRLRPVPLCIEPGRVERWSDAEPATSRQPAALIVGRMWSEERGKGHDDLIETWPEVVRRRPGAELWVVGVGDDAGRLESRSRELGLGGSVRFLGGVSDEELGELYRRASVFAMPSRQEGFGLVYAEAMWHGLACIASTADAAKEVIEHGRTGLLVPYGDRPRLADALVELLGDPDRAAGLGRAGSEYARSFYAYPRFRRDLMRALELDEEATG